MKSVKERNSKVNINAASQEITLDFTVSVCNFNHTCGPAVCFFQELVQGWNKAFNSSS